MSGWVTVAPLADFPPGSSQVVDVDGVAVAVFNIAGEVLAIEDVCSHDGNCLTGGDLEGEEIICPRHGARFSLRSGEALSAPAYDPVAVMPVRVESGLVQVRDPRWD